MTTAALRTTTHAHSAATSSDDEARLLAALRAGDEAAFAALVERHHRALVAVAQAYVPTREVAEEVVQETWLAMLRGIDRFEGRSALGTWLFSILLNLARRRGRRESRSIPFSHMAHDEATGDEIAVAADRFLPDGDRWAGHWTSPPRSWGESPEERLLAGETQTQIQAAIAALPPTQRTVITLRDVQGLSAEEVCGLLDISEGNQRVLLHRARSKVRGELEHYLTVA